jgi:hypothetical protein
MRSFVKPLLVALLVGIGLPLNAQSVARRLTAPVHAFGEAVTSQAVFGDWHPVAGVLFPFALREVDLATGESMDESTWQSIEANVPLAPSAFSPPPRKDTPVARLVNAIFASRHVPADALGWYDDFLRAHPSSARAHFGLGRAYRAAGREADALARFREAVRLDSTLVAARDALTSARMRY